MDIPISHFVTCQQGKLFSITSSTNRVLGDVEVYKVNYSYFLST
uniref:Uncharacterized protein n=1 Tax=Arundo donax TaxID=35708 RepID=A0A0A9AW99_ARUDO